MGSEMCIRDSDQAIHWVQSFDGVFMNTVGDVTLLPKVLDAASRYISEIPADKKMEKLQSESGMTSLFGLGV